MNNNNNTKRILVLSIMCMFAFAFAMPLVMAADADGEDSVSFKADGSRKSGGVHEDIDTSHWIFGTVQFFSLGRTWADIIVAVAVLLIVFGAAFDILGFTTLSTPWVKYLISFGIAAAFAVMGAISAVTIWLVGLVGGSIFVATIIAIIFGSLTLIGGTWLKGKAIKAKARGEADKILAAGELTKAKSKADIAEAKARAMAASRSAR